MSELFWRHSATVMLGLGGLLLLVAVGVYLINNVRRGRAGETDEIASNFEEMHLQGELSDEEYRTIKSVLRGRLQQQVKESGEQVKPMGPVT